MRCRAQRDDRAACSAVSGVARRHEQADGRAERRAGRRLASSQPTEHRPPASSATTSAGTPSSERSRPARAQPAAYAARGARHEVGQPVVRGTTPRCPRAGLRLGRRHGRGHVRSSRARSTSSCIVSTSASMPLERDHPAQPVDERHLDLDAVELEVVAVEDVGLDPALALAVEGRVGADADRGREASRRCRGGAASRRTRRRRERRQSPGRHVGGREAELAAALVAAAPRRRGR